MRPAIAFSIVLALVLAIPSSAAASCVDTTARQNWRGADVVFVGIARDSGDIGYTDFEVETYFKGSGSDRAHVRTGQTQTGVASSNDLVIRDGERWVVYAVERGGILRSDVCTGSHLIQPGDELPSADRLGAPETSIRGIGTDGVGGGGTGPPLGLIGVALLLSAPLIALVVVAFRTRQSG